MSLFSKVVNLLLDNKANIELRDSDGRTAFEDAAEEKGSNIFNE